MLSDNDFTAKLLDWFDKHGLVLPWRGADAYRIWLSEVMLQQTQIATVIPYYERFTAAYPTVEALAAAPLDDVLKLWEGLGYYSRARSLHHTAKIVAALGGFPRTVEGLMQLKGVGRYTAGAVASMAFNVRTPALDGNGIRVLTRLYDLSDDVTRSKTQAKLWSIAESLVPAERPGDFNQALMQLGQRICLPNAPRCAECPVRTHCQACARGTQSQRPHKPQKSAVPHYDVAAGLVYNDAGQLLIAQRRAEGLLGGLWEFPGGKQEAGETLPQTLQRELREELAIEVEVGELFCVVRHAFTHFKITLHTFEGRYLHPTSPYDAPQAVGCQQWAWVHEADLAQYAFGKADRMVIAELAARHHKLL
jgi:A/G-specific adenine glycosylase